MEKPENVVQLNFRQLLPAFTNCSQGTATPNSRFQVPSESSPLGRLFLSSVKEAHESSQLSRKRTSAAHKCCSAVPPWGPAPFKTSLPQLQWGHQLPGCSSPGNFFIGQHWDMKYANHLHILILENCPHSTSKHILSTHTAAFRAGWLVSTPHSNVITSRKSETPASLLLHLLSYQLWKPDFKAYQKSSYNSVAW